MFSHFGIYAQRGLVYVYDEKTKETTNFKVCEVKKESINEVEEMFKEIKTKIVGEIGCTCIYLNIGYNNDISKEFIESGKKNGFLRIHLIDELCLIYLHCLNHSKYIPKNVDVIWVLWSNELYIWEKIKSKAKLMKRLPFRKFFSARVTEEDLLKLKSKFNIYQLPNTIICGNINESSLFENVFPECEVLVFKAPLVEAETALIKAKLMQLKNISYEYQPSLCDYAFVKLYGKEIMFFEGLQSLPLKKTLNADIEKNDSTLKITAGNKYGEYIFQDEIKVTTGMLIAKKVLITFKIDDNGIYSLHYLMDKETLEKELINLYSRNLNEKPIYNIPQKYNIDNLNAVGIDLGTSRCCAAVQRRNGIETVALDNTGERLLPSYVGFNEEKEKCGQTVVSQLRTFAKSTVFDSKRIIGRDFLDVKFCANWPFEIINSVNTPLIRIQRLGAVLEKSSEDIAAVLLKHIKEKVEKFQGTLLSDVVITVPVAFTEKQKAATHLAALLAGWENIHLLPEPVAASIAYFVDRPTPTEFTMLLFDFGGGTLDVCIFKVSNGVMEIIAKNGDCDLGGRDFDNILFNCFSSLLKNKYEIDINQKDKLKYLLMQKCMEIKHALTAEKNATLDVSDFNMSLEELIHFKRHEFEEIAIELLNKINEVICSALAAANYTSCDINKVLLSGGSSRMPMVQEMLRKMFTKAEHSCEENPDEVVAIGAAHYAYYLSQSSMVQNISSDNYDVVEKFFEYLSTPPKHDIMTRKTPKEYQEIVNQAKKDLNLDTENYYNFAFFGHTETGKSSLINAIRGMKDNHPDAAEVGVTELTYKMKLYTSPDPRFKHVRIYDLPGTLRHISGSYYNEKKLYAFDCLIILIPETLEADEIKLALNSSKFNQPVLFVLSRCDKVLEWSLKKREIRKIDQEAVNLQLEKMNKAFVQEFQRSKLKELRKIPCFFINAYSLRDLINKEQTNEVYQEKEFLHYLMSQLQFS